jgi:hypothetical protein
MDEKEIKRWRLFRTQLDDADYIWLRNNTDRIQINRKTEEVAHRGSQPVHMTKEIEIIIQTSTARQEAMLKLKYDDKLILLTVVFLDPGQVYEDHFGVLTDGPY